MNFKHIALITVSTISLAACGSRVPAGNVGVKVYAYGGEKGVDTEVLSPGRYWIGWNEDLFLFPTFTQTVAWSGPVRNNNGTDDPADDSVTPDDRLVFQDKDGLKVSAGVSLTYSVDKTKVALLFQKYRRGIDEITDPYLKNVIRGALAAESSLLPVDQIYGVGKEALMKRVEERVRKQVEPFGLRIERLEWSGDMGLPQVVQVALNAKITATQKAAQRENELRQAEAEAAIAKANAQGEADAITVRAKAEAEANRIVSASLTPQLVQYEQAKKWDGVLPKVTGSATPIIDMR